jgi:hypothetical protein
VPRQERVFIEEKAAPADNESMKQGQKVPMRPVQKWLARVALVKASGHL